MAPKEMFELLQMLLRCGIEVRALYKSRRVVAALEKVDSHVIVRYENDDVDKIHIRDFGRRRFVVML